MFWSYKCKFHVVSDKGLEDWEHYTNIVSKGLFRDRLLVIQNTNKGEILHALVSNPNVPTINAEFRLCLYSMEAKS